MRQPHQRLERRIRVGRYPASNDALESRHRLDRHVRLVGELGLRQTLSETEGLDGAREAEGGCGHEGVGGVASGHGDPAPHSPCRSLALAQAMASVSDSFSARSETAAARTRALSACSWPINSIAAVVAASASVSSVTARTSSR